MNPFTVRYKPEYFCDREAELQLLKTNFVNGLNTLVHSPRRMGKTAMIRHLFTSLGNKKKYDTIYVDLFATLSMKDLIRKLSEKILEKYHQKNLFQGLTKILKGLRPVLTLSVDGTPQLSLDIRENEYENTLQNLFAYLESKNKKILIAFDEFQEIANYNEKAEAILRTHMQVLNNIYFIFSGSTNHLLHEMFYSVKRPFYQSSEVLVLGKIDRTIYWDFINNAFADCSKIVEPEALEYILDFTETYTYYTQVICNMLFYRTEKKLTYKETYELINLYLDSRKLDYQNILSLLPDNQKKITIAIAKEGLVSMPTSMDFLLKYNLPAVSSSSQAVNVLSKKEIIFQRQEGYVVYDVFFRRFLEKYY